MSFPRYPKYKPSGVEWLGDVPEGWQVRPFKYSTLVYTGNSLNETEKKLYESADSEALPYVSSKDIDLETHAVQYENGLRIPKEQCDLKVAKSGTFLLCVEGGSAGRKVALLSHDVCFVNKLCCFSSRQNNKFRFYFAQSQHFKDKFGLSLTGLIGGVSTSLLKNFQIPTPSDPEQTTIAEFLDRETGKIDGLVAEQRRLMELLKEKRQAVISHAVTKGLNPHAPMKPSGIEWLGDVPEHWEMKRLKYLGEAIIGLTYSPADLVSQGSGTLVLRSSNVQGGNIVFDDNVYVSSAIPPHLVTQVGDILICSRNGSRALIGKNATIDETSAGLTFGAFMTIFRSQHSDYIGCVLNSPLFEFQSGAFMTSTINQLTIGVLNNFEIPLPPATEREKVVAFLQSESFKFDTLTAEAQRAIDLLQERRTALISAAVTGQIDVRQQPRN